MKEIIIMSLCFKLFFFILFKKMEKGLEEKIKFHILVSDMSKIISNNKNQSSSSFLVAWVKFIIFLYFMFSEMQLESHVMSFSFHKYVINVEYVSE